MEEADEQSASRQPVGQREDFKSGSGRELEDELDIYNDMECTSPVVRNEDPQSVSNLLPPPPEPPRMLVDFGKSDMYEEMDDSVVADICRKGSDDSSCGIPCALNSPILESDIYDPAEPCMDSDDEIPVQPIYKSLDEDIPLPPGSPVGKLEESRTNVVSYSSTDSSGCESESGVKGKFEKIETSGQSTLDLTGEEGGLTRKRPQSPSSPKGQVESEEVLGLTVGENFLSHTDSRLSDTPDSEHLQKADESSVTGEFGITDNLEVQSKSHVKICKVCSKASEGDSELLGVCNCGSESSSVRKRKGAKANSTSSSLGSSSCSRSSSSNSICSSSSDSSDIEHSDKAVDCNDPKSGRDPGHKKKRKKKNQNLKIQKENERKKTDENFELNSKTDKFCTGTSAMVAPGKGIGAGEKCKIMETDITVSFDKSSTRNTVENSFPDPTAQLGLEGLDTESISENEAFNFDDYCSQSDNDRDSGEIDSAPPRKKRKLRNKLSGSRQSTSKSDIFKELDENISVPKLDWNSEDDGGKKVFNSKEDRLMERKGKKYEKENVTSDGTEVSKKNNFDKKSKKMNQAEIVSRIECKDNTISWKKISLEVKERNYRDSKIPRSGEKEKEYHSVKGMSSKKEKKLKEKRKDIERYDVRKVLNDKRKIGDRFGRDQSREYSFSRSRSRSNGLQHSRSRSVSRSKVRSPNRYRHRSQSRSRSRSYKSRRRLKNKTGRKSKSRESFSREKRRKKRSRSRNRRGSKSRSRSRSWNRSRSRSVVKSRKRQERGRNSAKSSQRMRSKRSWSRTWTPSWSRSRSGSTTSSSFSRSCSPPPRKFTRSFTHSFSRSWSREPHEHIPVPKPNTLVKSSKKHSVILAKPKDEEHHVKKGKKKKDSRVEKNKKRKERMIPPSKEVFTSGDNILVSVNFNKSTRSSGIKSGDSSILSSSCLSLPSKITSKHSHLDENFEIIKELTKKPKKEIISGDKILEEGTNVDNAGDAISKQKKKLKKSLKEDKRFAALLKQKPIAVIDLDHSPFKERTPSPTDLIVLSDSNEEAVNNDSKVEDENTSNPELKKLCLDIPSPPNKSDMIHGRASDVSITTGPKTPPEPPAENNPQAKDMLAVTDLPSRDDSVQPLEKVDFEEHSDTCPVPQANPTPTDVSVSSPGAYDPFDPTKSATPSPGGQESGVDTAMNISSVSGSHHAEEGNSDLTSETPENPDKGIEAKSSETSSESVSVTNSEQGSASVSLDATKDSPKTHLENKQVSIEELKIDLNVDVNNTVVNMEIDEADALFSTRPIESLDKDQNTTETPLQQVVTTTVSQISPECVVTSITGNETPAKIDLVSNNSKVHIPLVSTPIKPLQHHPLVTPPRNVPFLQIPPSLSTPLIHQPQPMLSTQHKLPLLSTPISKQPDCHVGPFNLSLDQGMFLTSTPITTSKDGTSTVPNISNISAIASYLVNSLAAAPQNPVLNTPLLKQLNISDTSHHTSLASIPTPPAHNGDRKQQKTQDTTEVVDMDLDSPYSPASSEGDDLFEPPPEMNVPTANLPPASTKLPQQSQKTLKPNRATESQVSKPSVNADPLHTLFSSIAKSANKPSLHTSSKSNTSINKSKDRHTKSTRKEIHIKRAADQLEILDELPSSAVELQVKEKFLKKLNRQERVVDEVKIALKPHYTKKYITKEEYKDILRRAVPKICHNEPGEINPAKVSSLIEAYVKKYRYAKKKFGSHSGDKDKSKTVM